MKVTRIQDLKAYIKSHRRVTNEELCRAMDVSMSTLRRDLQILQKEKFIKKIYGGVEYNETTLLTPYQYRDTQDTSGKNVIGRLAAELVKDDDVIFVDSGTTTPYILHYITAHNVTVLTNNAAVLAMASDFPNLSIFALPGLYYGETMSFFCPEMIDFLEKYDISRAFLAASGFSYRGATNNAAWEYAIKKYIAERVDDAYLCISASKIGVSRIITYCTPDQLKGIVTDRMPDEEMVLFLRQHRIRLIGPDKAPDEQETEG